MSSPELQRRHDAVRAGLNQREWSAALLTSKSNFVYLTGLSFDALWSSAARSMACIVPVDGPIRLVIPEFLLADAADALPETSLIGYDPPREPIDHPLSSLLATMPPGPIGWEAGEESRLGLTLDAIDSMRRVAGDRQFVDVSDLLWKIRMQKSPEELESLAAASRAGSLAMESVFGEGIRGRSEKEIAQSLARHALDQGADRVEWIACTSGEGSYQRFVSPPRDRVVEDGDLFWVDIGLTVGGYWSDFCRAAVAGSVSDERLSLQRAIVEATAIGVDRCRSGTPVAEVAATIRKHMTGLGLAGIEYGRLGHGIGLSSTEPPSIAEWDPTILEPGMVVAIEPAVADATGLYCAEQVVVVTDGEPEILTTASSDLSQA